MGCQCETAATSDTISRTFSSVSLPARRRMGYTAAADVAAAAVEAGLIETHHVSAFGDLLVSTQNPGSGTVDIKGNLGFIEVDLTIGVAVADGAVTLTITVKEPVKLGPAEWVFDVTGTSLTRRTAPSTVALMAASFDWSCVLKCGGDKILPILITCLPSLVGGPKAFVACAISQLASNSGDIAKCIATSCL
jgi:hypothetical protein